MTHTGPFTVRPWYFSSTMSSELSPFFCAVEGLIQTALSQVILFCGFEHSWSQPLFEKAPSQMVGSGRKTISRSCAGLGWVAGGALAVTFTGGSFVLGTTPSCSAFCQNTSKLGAFVCVCQYSRTLS